MWCKFPYNENFVALAKKYAGGNENLIINFAWPYWKAISQYASYSAMFCPLHNNIGQEQHEKHLGNPSCHYGKYGEDTRETRAPYLKT